MQIKKFEAASMTEALRAVKQEFGAEAVILSARSLKRQGGLLGGLRRPGVEVTAATDTYHKHLKNSGYLKGSADGRPIPSRIHETDSVEPEAMPRSLRDELAGFRSRISSPLARKRHKSGSASRESLPIYRKMLDHGVDRDVALKLMGAEEFGAGKADAMREPEFRKGMVRSLEKMGLATGPLNGTRGRQKLLVLVGPTGVGKTTTLAKLAVSHAFGHNRKVGLITLDNSRIGAVEQLKTYARIIGIPMESAFGKREFKEAIRKLKDRDLVLVDTPGMSQRNEAGIRELRDVLGRMPGAEIHLVLSATSKQKDLEDMLDGFKALHVNRLIFTKLDESTTYGEVINQALSAKIPVSYITNGQRVPEDLEEASVTMLVDLILGPAEEGEAEASSPGIDGSGDDTVKGRGRGQYYVANVNSDVFHSPECRWAKRIKPENLIVLGSVKDVAAGNYKACGLCNPLENTLDASPKMDTDRKRAGYG
jgi:flagellar biosynthesis protein FlhF